VPTACTLARLLHPPKINPTWCSSAVVQDRNHGTKGGRRGHERAPLSSIVTTTTPEHVTAVVSCLPCPCPPGCLARPRPHVSTNERAGACCTAQRRATPRAANPMGLREERPPLFASVCVIKRRDAIGFRVRLQIAEALSSSRFSWHAAQDGSGLGGEAVTRRVGGHKWAVWRCSADGAAFGPSQN
jgi:hypothetical protein